MPFDEVFNAEGSQSIDSDQEDEAGGHPAAMQVQAQQRAPQGPRMPAQLDPEEPARPAASAVPVNAYNPMHYSNLKVSAEISELFQYISRYHPHDVELETRLKPFVPDYVPAVGEVDAFLKVPRPDGAEEMLGLYLLDEPAINPVDPSVLEMQYIQTKKKKQTVQVQVRSLENAESNPKQIQQWINSVNELHKTRPPPTVQYTKGMPDIELLMQEWPPEMEEAFNRVALPGPEMDVSVGDYARLVCSMMDIPVHKLNNNKSVVEALHHLFTLYAEFKDNPHFGRQRTGMNSDIGNKTDEKVDYMKIS